MKLKIIFGFVFLFMISSVYADLTTNNPQWLSYDNDDLSGSNPLDLSSNGNDGTNNGATAGGDGPPVYFPKLK